MLYQEIYDRIRKIPVVDIHSHLRTDAMAASDPGKLLFYHMVQYPLRAAGIPQEKLWRPESKIHDNLHPYDALVTAWPAVSTTSFGFALTTILRDLYGFTEPLTKESLERLTKRFHEHTGKRDWGSSVLDRASITDVLTSNIAKDAEASPLPPTTPPHIHYTLERGFSSGPYEYTPPIHSLHSLTKRLGMDITSYSSLKEAVSRHYRSFNWHGRHALVAWVSSLADFSPCDSTVIDTALAALQDGKKLDEHTHALLDAAFIRCTCEAAREHTGILQLVYGTQFLTPTYPHPVQRAAASFASTLGHLIGEFPDLHFNILNGYEPDEPRLCSLCLAYHNVSLGGFWWHTFYPSVMQQAWHRRLDMVPTSRLMGFFSDGYCVDWIYARLRITQRVLSQVLAQKIEWGYYSMDQALEVARAVLCATPKRLLLKDDECRMRDDDYPRGAEG